MELVNSDEIEYITCEDVEEDELEWVVDKGEEMIKYCAENGGLGLAAPQIGIYKNFFVYSPREEIFQIVINPSWFPDGKKTNTVEGCLSYPGQNYFLTRYKYVRAVYYGRSKKTGRMERVAKRLSGDDAIIFQHETDHLRGKTVRTKGRLIENG
jgi:peptide deformylase